jgi:Ran GTPase-activating protein (RanGAP) involved in mRNA processing and transport
MGAEGLHLMSAILPRLPSLHSINFSSINAGDGGIGHLSAHLPDCCALQSLDLSCNKFRATGAWRLAWALPTSLRILNICNNDIGDEGARHLSGALPHCDALEDLDLTSTGIGDEGAGLLAEILPRCSSLRILSLSHTMMGATGARGLMDCVDRCANPPELNLEGIFHTC